MRGKIDFLAIAMLLFMALSLALLNGADEAGVCSIFASRMTI
jgi:hypothetical protein